MTTSYRTQRTLPREPQFMHGTPGTIYILQNDGLRKGLYKIGATRRSGVSKAMELNRDLQQLIPGSYECVFELHTKDCGHALDEILKQFQHHRCGKRGQDFYDLDLDAAAEKIANTIALINRQGLIRQQQTLSMMRHLEPDEPSSVSNAEAFSPPPASLFRKAYEWVAG
ncbi:GIY-YIG nuclease family protein [Undibacterium sp. CY18W]|uniref:GIY-YIG nuclease family protein n=1 Tax=Undibacterium hunanense TaxID=2762292 RepID=A0ABR6ZXT1_9BURK|nr:GIY-YIG nuclease family protein [Undibacterium hunanense]MBC3920665.1 GIY-YIG nuclease family protein [Undibacterium hunanense]